MVNRQIDSLYRTNKLSTKSKDFYGNIETFLSERYKDIIKRQVDGMLKSHISNRKNDFKTMVYKSTLSENEKKDLYLINRRNLWFNTENKLARKIFRNLLKENRFPSTKNINITLNTKVYRLEKNKITKTSDYHIVLRTCLKDNKEITIPLKRNTYFTKILKQHELNKTNFKINNSIQLNFNKNKLKNIVLTITHENNNTYKSENNKIGIDFGLCNLFTLHNGDILGKNFINKLTYYDSRITKLQNELKKRNKYFKLRENKRYCDLIHKLKSFIKNEVNRIINNIVKKYKPSSIVIENLNFMNTKLSKKLNRLFRNCGLGVLKTKLESLNIEFNIKIQQVNPAYTSQQCSSCHYIHTNNRKTRDDFQCLSCGKKLHADINAARVIIRRSNDNYLIKNKYLTKSKIKQYIMEKHHNMFSDRGTSSAKVDVIHPPNYKLSVLV